MNKATSLTFAEDGSPVAVDGKGKPVQGIGVNSLQFDEEGKPEISVEDPSRLRDYSRSLGFDEDGNPKIEEPETATGGQTPATKRKITMLSNQRDAANSQVDLLQDRNVELLGFIFKLFEQSPEFMDKFLVIFNRITNDGKIELSQIEDKPGFVLQIIGEMNKEPTEAQTDGNAGD